MGITFCEIGIYQLVYSRIQARTFVHLKKVFLEMKQAILMCSVLIQRAMDSERTEGWCCKKSNSNNVVN